MVNSISKEWLGAVGGVLAILGVIAAPITSGDTALRSARLIAADFMNIKQKKITRRLLVSVPIFLLCFVVMTIPYEALWRYFAWCNQVLSVFTLWAITVYLARRRKTYAVTMIPAMFMTAVTVTYIFFAPEGFSALTESALGHSISYEFAVGAGLTVTALFTALFIRYRRTLAQTQTLSELD